MNTFALVLIAVGLGACGLGLLLIALGLRGIQVNIEGVENKLTLMSNAIWATGGKTSSDLRRIASALEHEKAGNNDAE